jgi:hypothetical protein
LLEECAQWTDETYQAEAKLANKEKDNKSKTTRIQLISQINTTNAQKTQNAQAEALSD